MELKVIATIKTGFSEKFGIPRQSGMVENTVAEIVFEPEYRNADAVRGLEGFSHIWLIWQFSKSVRDGWSPTVRPPRLGGNSRMGVFATRSPFRPNELGLSSVKLLKIETTKTKGPVLYVSGADLLDGTPIFDIKPYLKFTDSHPDALDGFTESYSKYRLEVEFPEELKKGIAPSVVEQLTGVLSADPRPSYQNDPERIYGLCYCQYEVKFTVDGGVLYVKSVENNEDGL
ncbi:MAG: tRNA (N6-threonylcarbamoyladenosine(37)-N6)-methyltransferase TrmO [Ruminococcaceae bacterium]|nr:tRNA (N6-threonylcarbamoyladenosine(37)-N6)-methyltransferase TrmO [Oscillospiraceae bacterium]